MKHYTTIFAAAAMLLISSCGNPKPEATDTAPLDSAAIATPEAAPTNLKLIVIQHKVKDFDVWKPAYFSHDSVRKAYGITHYLLARGLDDPNMVMLMDKIEDLQKAKEFSELPALKEVMQAAGVISAPVFSYVDVVRNDDSVIEQKDRLMISHHVKDFDAWLKVYDDEGKETRAANGLIDRGLGRGIDDPNMVTVVFAITDMAKAKARANSEELKKLMLDAGVEGPPQIFYYRLVE